MKQDRIGLIESLATGTCSVAERYHIIVDQFPTWAQFAHTFLVVSPCGFPCSLGVTDCVTRRRLDQTASVLHVFAKHVSRTCLIWTPSTRVLHNHVIRTEAAPCE